MKGAASGYASGPADPVEQMNQVEIPREHWRLFADEFTRVHQTWLVTVATVETARWGADPDAAMAGWHRLREGVQLQNVAIRETPRDVEVQVQAGGGEHVVSDGINGVVRVFRLLVDGRHRGLRIDGNMGQSMVVWFRAAAAPEELDDILESD